LPRRVQIISVQYNEAEGPELFGLLRWWA
jgi:hypothetical protein